jgi:hypothetical protein
MDNYKLIKRLFLVAILFFIIAAIFMPVWNYILPKIVGSIDSGYDQNTFTDIDYTTSIATTLLILMIFGDISWIERGVYDMTNKSLTYLNVKRKSKKSKKSTSYATDYDFDADDL